MSKIRGFFRQIDTGYLVALLIMLIAIWPFLSRVSLPPETDAELHVFRLAELSRTIRGGVFYPRWAPNFYYGYGYPIFNYYAPLSYYVGLLVELLPNYDAVTGVKFAFVMGILSGGIGLYGYVSVNWGRAAGFVSTALFAYAPYVMYVDPHARGDLAESFSFGLFPLALWALDDARRRHRPLSYLAAVLTSALIIVSHNLMAMVFIAMLVGWLVWQTVTVKWAGHTGRSVLLLSTTLLLGVLVAAFFWLPVAFEQDAVNLSTLIGEGEADHFDFRNHFLSFSELFGGYQWLDWGATEPGFELSLGVPQWVMGLLGIVALSSGMVKRREQGLYFAGSLLFLIFLMGSASQLLWENVPLLPFLQFPWRLLGPSVIMCAVLGGIATEAAIAAYQRQNLPKTTTVTWLIPAALVAVIMMAALPLTQLPPWEDGFTDTSARGVLEIERKGRWLGTTSTADFVPTAVQVVPKIEQTMLAAYEEGRAPDRVNRVTLPAGTTVDSTIITPLHTRYQIESSEPFPLRLFLFSYPGWQATIDGVIVETEIAAPEGFIVVPVPAGTHQVDVEFVDTPIRRTAWWMTGIALFVALIGLVYIPALTAQLPRINGDEEPKSTTLQVSMLAVVGALWLGLVLLIEPAGWLHYHSSGRIAEPAEHQIWADLGGQTALIGYDISSTQVSPGDTIELVLYWRAQMPLEINFQGFVHVLTADNHILTQSDKLNPGEFPTRRWPEDKYVRDSHRLFVPEDAPAGEYRLTAGMWVQSEGWRLPLLDEGENQVGDNIELTIIIVDN